MNTTGVLLTDSESCPKVTQKNLRLPQWLAALWVINPSLLLADGVWAK